MRPWASVDRTNPTMRAGLSTSAAKRAAPVSRARSSTRRTGRPIAPITRGSAAGSEIDPIKGGGVVVENLGRDRLGQADQVFLDDRLRVRPRRVGVREVRSPHDRVG